MTNNIQVLPGAEGIKQAYRMSLEATSLDIMCLAEEYEQVVGDFFEAEFAPELYKKATREILPDSPDNKEYAQKKDEKNEVRFINGQSESDLLISDEKVILISFNQKSPYAVMISDETLVQSFKNQYEALWENIKD